VYTPLTAPFLPIHHSSHPTGFAMAVNRAARGKEAAGAS
jgi:hypothetical protein